MLIYTSRLALEKTFLLNKYFFLQMAYELLSQSRKLINSGEGGEVLIRVGGLENFLKKKNNWEGRLLGTPE